MFFSDFCSQNKLVFFTPEGNHIELIDLNHEPVSHRIELPMPIKVRLSLVKSELIEAGI